MGSVSQRRWHRGRSAPTVLGPVVASDLRGLTRAYVRVAAVVAVVAPLELRLDLVHYADDRCAWRADPQAVYSTGGELETIRKWLHQVKIAEVAEISGISERMLREIRQGKRNPSRNSMEGILRALAEMIGDPSMTDR